MKARIVVTVTAKVYLGDDIDLSGTTAPSASRYPETTQQVTLTEACEVRNIYGVQIGVWDLGDRCTRAVGDACRDAVAKKFKA